MARPVSVLIVDDHQMVAEGLTSLLSEHPRVEVVGTAGSIAGAVTAAEASRPDVILMDFRLSDGQGTTAARLIRETNPEVAIVFLSAEPNDEVLLSAVEAGACGFISKEVRAQDLLESILRAADGEFLLPAATMARLLSGQREDRRRQAEQWRLEQEITPREREILRLMALGHDNHEIADRLGIAYGTVRAHVRSLLEKLDSRSRLQAVVAGRERGLLG